MVASTLGVAEDGADPRRLPGAGHDHAGEEHDAAAEAAPGDDLHPWALEMYRKGLSFNGKERSRLFLGRGDGTFEDLSDVCGADSPLDGRALLACDFDVDGDVDLFVHNIQRERHNLYRNELDRPERSLAVRLRATGSQHEAIGATVTVDGPRGPLTQVLSRGGGIVSCQAPELVFGLGERERVPLRVRWPGGRVESFGELGPGAVLLVEGSGRAEPLPREPFALRDPLPDGLKLAIGERVPALVVLDHEGRRTRLDPVQVADGGRVYLNFWASYCSPCLRELPTLNQQHRTSGRTVVAVSVDVPKDHDVARAVLAASGAEFPSYFLSMDEEDSSGGMDELVDLLRLPIPTTLVLGPDGTLEEVLRGPLEAD